MRHSDEMIYISIYLLLNFLKKLDSFVTLYNKPDVTHRRGPLGAPVSVRPHELAGTEADGGVVGASAAVQGGVVDPHETFVSQPPGE